jgi:hypothetical protein
LGERRLDKAEVAGSSPARPIESNPQNDADSDHSTPPRCLGRQAPERRLSANLRQNPVTATPSQAIGVGQDPHGSGDVSTAEHAARLRLRERCHHREDRPLTTWTAGSRKRSPPRSSRSFARSLAFAPRRRTGSTRARRHADPRTTVKIYSKVSARRDRASQGAAFDRMVETASAALAEPSVGVSHRELAGRGLSRNRLVPGEAKVRALSADLLDGHAEAGRERLV